MSMLWYTLGPASAGKELQILEAGATGVRLTFSFSTADYQQERALEHRRAAETLGAECLVVADLAGEKFRLGSFDGAPVVPVHAGQRVTLVQGETCRPDADWAVAVRNGGFFASLCPGDLVTVGDGSTVLSIDSAESTRAEAIVEVGGTLNQNRGLTVQGSNFRPRCLTEKDLADLEFISRSDAFDAVALSFVSDPADIHEASAILKEQGRELPLIAKIETQAGVENAAEIAQAADMVMAARGDLALAIPWVELPGAVWSIEEAALAANTPWIIATQVVEGLERFVIPTRAEICDLASWMRRGCAGALVSYETAFGANPVAAVRSARQIIDRWSAAAETPNRGARRP